jgi:hypothetical protein
MNITTLPPRDPVFALAPELRLHLSERDGALVVNSREVSRVFHRRHRRILCNIMREIWDLPKRPDRDGYFRLRADGTIDMTSEGFVYAMTQSRWRWRSKRGQKFVDDWDVLFLAMLDEYRAKTGISLLAEGIRKILGLEPVSFSPELPRPKPRLVTWAHQMAHLSTLCGGGAFERYSGAEGATAEGIQTQFESGAFEMFRS